MNDREPSPADTLRNVARYALAQRVHRMSRDDAIRDAHAAGHSLRALAEAAGLSHETIRYIVGKGRPV